MIYGINCNEIYGELMDEIDELYDRMGSPDEFDDDEERTSTTTGNADEPYWDADTIGDWDGNEDAAAAFANAALDEVYAGLGLMGNGGISHYYTSAKWDEFVEAALDLLNEYHSGTAFDKLCDVEGI